MKSRWMSPRALLLHLMLVAWVAVCAGAGIWQIGRAANGNGLSFAYAIEWPAFAVAGVFGWWKLIHADEVDDEQVTARKEYEDRMRSEAAVARKVDENEDPALAAYNDHLADLAQRGEKKKLWGH